MLRACETLVWNMWIAAFVSFDCCPFASSFVQVMVIMFIRDQTYYAFILDNWILTTNLILFPCLDRLSCLFLVGGQSDHGQATLFQILPSPPGLF